MKKATTLSLPLVVFAVAAFTAACAGVDAEYFDDLADAGQQPDTGAQTDAEPDAQPDVGPPAPVDDDGDGHTVEVDCNDSDPYVHPGATEVCNGVDDDCDGTTDDAIGNFWYLDADGDGFGDPSQSLKNGCTGVEFLSAVAGDCNDADPAIHPDAVEACDNVDNDCDGDTDEAGASGENVWYVDNDGDGFGSDSSHELACESRVSPGFVVNDDDCDDGSKFVYPGATEFCDEQDNDCDGEIDEGLLTTFYWDFDGDGYGDPTAKVSVACAPMEMQVEDKTDCDDGDGSVHPGATELCNGMDDDCDGTTDEAVPSQCDDANPFTVDACDTSTGQCVSEDILVSFTCDLPDDVTANYECGTGVFFESAQGKYSENLVQKLGGLLELTVNSVCWELAQGATLHVNTFMTDPFDPWYEWIGGEYTDVNVPGQMVIGTPGTVTMFPFGLDTNYVQANFQICNP